MSSTRKSREVCYIRQILNSKHILKLWHLMDKRDKFDLRLTKCFAFPLSPFMTRLTLLLLSLACERIKKATANFHVTTLYLIRQGNCVQYIFPEFPLIILLKNSVRKFFKAEWSNCFSLKYVYFSINCFTLLKY